MIVQTRGKKILRVILDIRPIGWYTNLCAKVSFYE